MKVRGDDELLELLDIMGGGHGEQDPAAGIDGNTDNRCGVGGAPVAAKSDDSPVKYFCMVLPRALR